MNYVLDACALIALLDEEEGADIVQDIITKAIDGDVTLYMSIINYTEVYYDRLKIGGPEKAKLFVDNLFYLPITIVDGISRVGTTRACPLPLAARKTKKINPQKRQSPGRTVTVFHAPLQKTQGLFITVPPIPQAPDAVCCKRC